jgi:DNA-binding NarL/FixJ family response regulator
MEKKYVRVLVADDHEIARRGLRDMFETADDILLVGETDSVHSIPRLILQFSPDVLLIDLKWDDYEAAGWMKIIEIRREYPGLKIIAITAHPNLAPDAWNAGADQVVTKSLRREDLLELIKTVSLRNAAFHPDDSASREHPEQLSNRELEVLHLIDKGLSDKEISKALNITVHTTKNHVKNIRQKLGAENRYKACIKARELGILK